MEQPFRVSRSALADHTSSRVYVKTMVSDTGIEPVTRFIVLAHGFRWVFTV